MNNDTYFPQIYTPSPDEEWQFCPITTTFLGLEDFQGKNFMLGGIPDEFASLVRITSSLSREERAISILARNGQPPLRPETGGNFGEFDLDWVLENLEVSTSYDFTKTKIVYAIEIDKPDAVTERSYRYFLTVRAWIGRIQENALIDAAFDNHTRGTKYDIYYAPFYEVYDLVNYEPVEQTRISQSGSLYFTLYAGSAINYSLFSPEAFDQRYTYEDGHIKLTQTNSYSNDGGFVMGFSSVTSANLELGLDYVCDYGLWNPVQDRITTITGTSHGWNSALYSGNYGSGAEPGGYGQDDENGSHDFSSDDIGLPTAPVLGATSSGFYNLYYLSDGELSDLGEAMFPHFPWDSVDPSAHPVETISTVLSYLGSMTEHSKIIDYFIDIHIVPCNVQAGNRKHITAGGRDFYGKYWNPATEQYEDRPYTALTVSSPYVSNSCGSVTIPECYGNFLDYMVRCKLYLPCYGYVEIPAEYWNGGTISVDYMFNIIDGSFVAYVRGRAKHSLLNSLIGQYSGVAITHIPIRGADYSNIVASLTAGTIGAIGATSMIGSGIGALAGASALSNFGSVATAKPNMINNGSSNSSSSMMMYKTPYLIIEYPTPQFSERYPKEKGLPLNVSSSLGAYGGMTIAEDVVLDGIPCTEREKERIRTALKSGLIFR